MAVTPPGALVISLDLELYWGVHDIFSLAEAREKVLGERRAVDLLLEVFAEFDLHATWAVVGLLYFRTRDELMAHLPRTLPRYRDANLSPYPKLDAVGPGEEKDPLHFGSSLLERIRQAPGQELATHTFSHYFALEEPQDPDVFRDDLEAALKIARLRGDTLESIVFPRNQVNPAFLTICGELGIRTYRGTEKSWLYRPGKVSEISLLRRGFRLIDTFLPLSSHNAFPRDGFDVREPRSVPSSRFLRPYAPWRAFVEPLRIRRITADLTHAGRHGLVYHLWWHPSNFSANTERNLAALRRVLEHFVQLRDRYGMESLSMAELVPAATHDFTPR